MGRADAVTPRLPDAHKANWVDAYAPPIIQPWLKLGRFDRPTGIWLLMLPGWQGAALAAAEDGRWPSPWLILGIFIGAALMRAAGCAYNDLVDRDIDAKVARTANRPLASGQISAKGAYAFIAVCSLISLCILLTMGLAAILLGVGSLLLVAAYPFMKRITWWPQAWLGLTFNWGALLGYAAASGTLSWSASLLYIGGLAWTLGYDTVYALQDLEDDAMIGVKSSARRLGAHVKPAVLGFYVLAFILALACVAVGKLGPLFLPFAGLYALQLSHQASKVDREDPVAALGLFKSNTVAGLILFAGIVAGMWKPAGF